MQRSTSRAPALTLSSLCLLGLLALQPDLIRASLAQEAPLSNEFIWIGDQVIERSELADSERARILGARPHRITLWREGILPIQFKNDVDPATRTLFWAACQEWETAANIRCIEGEYEGSVLTVGRSYLGIKSGCWSMIGSSRYFLWLKRRMNLGTGCDTYPIILHEIGHALGLTHEHQRMDRDDYVEILTENIGDPFLGFGKKLNFAKQSADPMTPYDFKSIMHYGKKASSKNGQNTIVPRPGFESMLDVIGRARGLSEQDREAISGMYGR